MGRSGFVGVGEKGAFGGALAVAITAPGQAPSLRVGTRGFLRGGNCCSSFLDRLDLWLAGTLGMSTADMLLRSWASRASCSSTEKEIIFFLAELF